MEDANPVSGGKKRRMCAKQCRKLEDLGIYFIYIPIPIYIPIYIYIYIFSGPRT